MKIRADMLKRALSKKHYQDFFLTEVKNGATHFANELLIMDALAIKKSWANPCITGYEIKVSRQDFLRDEKWPAYKALCHRFSFVCPKGLIEPSEIPEDVGLIWYNSEKQTLYTKRKSVYRNIEISAEMLYYILMSRLDNERHPFFSSEREAIEAYLEEKEAKRKLSVLYKHKLAEEAESAIEEAKNAKYEYETYKKDADNFKKVIKIMRDNGIWFNEWHWEKNLQNALKAGLPSNIERIISRLDKDVQELKEVVPVK